MKLFSKTPSEPIPPTADDARKLRDALREYLESASQSLPSRQARAALDLSDRLELFPVPSGVHRKLQQVIPPKASEAKREPKTPSRLLAGLADLRELPPLFGEVLEALLEALGRVALPDPALQRLLARFHANMPQKLGVPGAKKVRTMALELKEEAGPVRKRFLASQREISDLVYSLVERVRKSHELAESTQAFAKDLARRLDGDGEGGGEALPESIRGLRKDLISGLQRIEKESVQLKTELHGCEDRIAHLERRLQEQEAEIAFVKASHGKDPITELLNPDGFKASLAKAVQDCAQLDHPLGMLVLDIDGFEGLNKEYGRGGGDTILKAVARMIQQGLRKSDIVARLTSDIFAVVLPRRNPMEVQNIARELQRRAASTQFVYMEHRFRLTCTVGACSLARKESSTHLEFRARQLWRQAKRPTGGGFLYR